MSETQKPIEIFCSYTHEDEFLLKKFETHLSLLKRQGLIAMWHHREIMPGTDWAQVIDAHLNSASVILLLISPDFFASDYCYGIEMMRALERHRHHEACVIPILLRPVDWHGAPFAHLQALPTNAKPVTTWSNSDQAFVDIATGLRRAIGDLGQLAGNTPDEKPVRALQDASDSRVENYGPVQGLVIGDHATVYQHFHGTSAPPNPQQPLFLGRADKGRQMDRQQDNEDLSLAPGTREELVKAFMSAFPRRAELAMFVSYKLNENLEALAGGQTLRQVIFDVVIWAESTGKLRELVKGASESNPGNALLRAFVRRYMK